jgi:hypothetical protein
MRPTRRRRLYTPQAKQARVIAGSLAGTSNRQLSREEGIRQETEAVTLHGADLVVRPRHQALRTAPGTPLMAYARIEVDRDPPACLSHPERAAVIFPESQGSKCSVTSDGTLAVKR